MSDEIKDLKIPMQEELEKMRKENETLLRELHRNQAVNREIFTDYQKMMADQVEINITGNDVGKRRGSREDSLMVTPSLATNTFFPKMHSVDYHEDSSIGNFHDISISSVGKHRYNQSVGGVGVSNVSKRAYRTDYKTSSATPGRFHGKMMMTTAIGFGERKQPGAFELPPVGKDSRHPSAKAQKKPNISAIVNLNPFEGGKDSRMEPTGNSCLSIRFYEEFHRESDHHVSEDQSDFGEQFQIWRRDAGRNEFRKRYEFHLRKREGKEAASAKETQENSNAENEEVILNNNR